jgi:GT2 family glycosyltransferase
VRWFGRLIGNHHIGGAGVRHVDFLKGCNMSVRRNLVSPIDERLMGSVPYGFEIDLGLAVRNRGHLVVYDPEIVVDHYASSDMRSDQPALAKVSNHNQTYILMKHLPTLRQWAFLAYTFLIGDRNTIGLARVPLQCWPARWPGMTIRAHFDGKLAALATYRSWRRSSREEVC